MGILIEFKLELCAKSCGNRWIAYYCARKQLLCELWRGFNLCVL